MTSAAFSSLMPVKLGARDAETSTKFSRGESIGLAFDTMAGLGSTLAATIILIIIFCRIHRDGWSIWEALDVSVISLFVAELVQGIGHAMDLKWVIEGQANTGSFCTAQGLMQQLGETSVALATLTIAVQTFLTIWWLQYLDRTVSVLVTAVEYIFVALVVGIGFGIHTHPTKEYYAAPTPYWCWLGDSYNQERIGLEYAWLWLTLFGSLCLYIPLFLLHRGIIKPGTSWYSPNADLSSTRLPRTGETNENQRDAGLEPGHSSTGHVYAGEPSPGLPSNPELEVLSRENPLLWSTILYPIVYCVMVLPLSVVRWIGFREEATTGENHRPPLQTFIVAIIFSLSGVFNAFLYPLTRARFFQSNKMREPKALHPRRCSDLLRFLDS